VKELVSSCDVSQLFKTYKLYYSPVIFSAIKLFGTNESTTSDTLHAILEELVNAGADVNESNVEGFYFNPLLYALNDHNLPLCKCLARLGAAIRFEAEAPFIFSQAVETGPEYVAFFLEQGVHSTDEQFCVDLDIAVGMACIGGSMDVLELFMDWYDANGRIFPWYPALKEIFLCGFEDSAIALSQRAFLTKFQHEECFFLAAAGGSEKLKRLMIEQRPKLLQSEWLVNEEIPDVLQSDENREFLTWLMNTRSQPLQLQVICRLNILRQLGRRPQALIDTLPLPNKLKEYLKLPEVL
jgi:hypothetical protein